jgi:hypothetical protein
MARAGSRAGHSSCCQWTCCQPCSAGCSWTSSRRLSGGCATILRQAYPTDRSASIRRLSGAAVEHKVGGLLQAPLRRPEAGVALSRPVHPPRRHLKSPLDCMRRERRHRQVEGLQDRRSRPLQGDDTRRARVHPPLSHARAARRLSPHPLLYGLLASGKRAENVARARELLMPPIIPLDATKAINPHPAEPEKPKHFCPCCGGRMIIIERFERGATPHYRPSPPTPAIRIDTS